MIPQLRRKRRGKILNFRVERVFYFFVHWKILNIYKYIYRERKSFISIY